MQVVQRVSGGGHRTTGRSEAAADTFSSCLLFWYFQLPHMQADNLSCERGGYSGFLMNIV
ncbi:MAG: hypothetical protein CSA33_00560 [Desulfobulbus propionicus]|nr:MAG: hypothetical protein CSA33_00560 [Desulfobulbus propionicus]